ncbi:MAG: hypothetical protein C0606_08350 [Hyphomicrobiales bacterium]|nr:MAG: hypothetical protein C0606_08350 [Hyphomicrobiales bacterium]
MIFARSKRRFVAAVLPVLAAVALMCGGAGAMAEPTRGCGGVKTALGGLYPLDTTRQAPDIKFTDHRGREFHLSDFRGRPMVITFWKTTCVPCIKEMPHLDRLQVDMRDEKVLVLAINRDRRAPKVLDFYNTYGIRNLALVTDPFGLAARDMGISALPMSVVVDGEGVEQARVIGALDWSLPEVQSALRSCVGLPEKTAEVDAEVKPEQPVTN